VGLQEYIEMMLELCIALIVNGYGENGVKKKDGNMKRKILGIVIIGIILISMVGLTGCFDNKEDFKSVNVLITDAPFGKYWVHSYGAASGFIFFSGYFNSNLVETYTIKYMDGIELKTLIISSTDTRLHVILTDDNTSMHMDIRVSAYSAASGKGPQLWDYMNIAPNYKGVVVTSTWDYTYTYVFNLFIPRPEICTISDEVIE
jgi:hypothetical protein